MVPKWNIILLVWVAGITGWCFHWFFGKILLWFVANVTCFREIDSIAIAEKEGRREEGGDISYLQKIARFQYDKSFLMQSGVMYYS